MTPIEEIARVLCSNCQIVMQPFATNMVSTVSYGNFSGPNYSCPGCGAKVVVEDIQAKLRPEVKSELLRSELGEMAEDCKRQAQLPPGHAKLMGWAPTDFAEAAAGLHEMLGGEGDD